MSTRLAATRGRDIFGTVGVAMVTPFDSTGALDVVAGQRLAKHLVDNGVDALVLAGTTGEAPTTTTEEKVRLLQAVREVVGEGIKLIAGAGTNNTQASIDLAKASADAGADALLVVTPYYSKPSQRGIVAHFEAIAQAIPLPICAYDIPARSVVPMTADTIVQLAAIDTVVAMKDAKGNIAEATTLIQDSGLAWYSGDDPLNLPWLSVGASGFISVIGHLAPQQLREVFESFDSGDIHRAQKVNAKIAPLVAAQARLGGVTLAKAGLRLQGIEVGDPRLPITAPTDQELEVLRADMKNAGVL